MDLSCIIVNYRNSEPLRDCLESIFRTLQDLDFEVIIVDNSQDDPGIKTLEGLYPKAKFISNSSNVGFAKGNNQAARIAAGDVLLFLNPDIVLSDRAIASMYPYLCSNPETGILGPKVVNPDGSLQYSCRRYPTLLTGLFNRYSLLSRLFPGNRFTKKYLMLDFDHNSNRSVDWLSGCCLMMPGIVFEKAGGFDEKYFLFNEDVDLCRTINQLDKKITYFPGATVTHRISSSNSKSPSRIIIQRHLGMMYYFKKHHGENLLVRGIVNFFIALRCTTQLMVNCFK